MDATAQNEEERSDNAQPEELYDRVRAAQIIVDTKDQHQCRGNQGDEEFSLVNPNRLSQKIINQRQRRKGNYDRSKYHYAAQSGNCSRMNSPTVDRDIKEIETFAQPADQRGDRQRHK